MQDRYEIRLSGEGGQGLVLAGVILAEAASIYENKNAVQSQSYGPEARGGASKSEVVISTEDIDYPKATEIDAFLCLTQESCDKYYKDVKDTGLLIADSTLVKNLPNGKFKRYILPIIDTASNKVGKVIVANIVALGVIVGLTQIVSREAIEKAILGRVPKGTEELNKKALYEGFTLAENALKA